MSTLTDQEFSQIRQLLHEITGIHLSEAKKPLVLGRLSKRLRKYELESYGDYLRLIQKDATERQVAIDLLTTNETHFFREPKHFDFLTREVLPHVHPGAPFRVWSAACSTGEEPYSIAMVLAESLGAQSWEILATDISTRVLKQAETGQYPIERAKEIPEAYLKKFCKKGIRSQEGTFLIDRELRDRIHFKQLNLNASLPKQSPFDVIFLRNVMIYFNPETKRRIVGNLVQQLRPNGYMMIGHSESLNGISEDLSAVQPATYRKPG